ncbi:hypothetical protein SAMN02745664_10939 [Moraxella cuniculi DSM 21768]|uniref:Uncharacterized protein n=1 Tax=Moraxella cuniculi DSM 21768 TaxID=1122245 RepID=A0A1N7F2L9_9GAMM|nr:YqcI/YcgG family protein [Moraxella cuniculi]SIR94462.1 hypothetical protein SAMN02745664_10939 [Moraxella cuniculi DSM 21768]
MIELSKGIDKQVHMYINPREVFDLVAPIDRQKGLNIRRIIRNRICVFNKSQKYPSELGFFGDINNLEWRQYQLYEEGGLVIDTCPIKMPKERIDV